MTNLASARNVGRVLVAFVLIWGLGRLIRAFATLGHPATGWVEHAGPITDWIAIAIGLVGLLLVFREGRIKREETARRHARRVQTHLRQQAEFRELRFARDPAGSRRFVYAWPAAWEQRLPTTPDPPMPWEDAFFLHLIAGQLEPGWVPSAVGVGPNNEDNFVTQGGRVVYQTDPAFMRRSRFLYRGKDGSVALLGLMPTRDGKPQRRDVCLEHRRFFDLGTPRCGDCDLAMEQVREKNPRIIRALGLEDEITLNA